MRFFRLDPSADGPWFADTLLAAMWFAALRGLLGLQVPDALRADDRSRRPPIDRFNALLSFGYGLLHTAVLRAVLARGYFVSPS